MAASSSGGLWISGLYRDTESVAAMLRGYDFLTLVFVVPVFGVALIRARESVQAQLQWIGSLAFSVYNYAIFVFGASFNDFFLVHVALFSMSIVALAALASSLDMGAIANRFDPRTPVRIVAGVLGVLAISLGAMWIVNSLRFALDGVTPPGSKLVEPIAITHLGYVLDLSLLIPGYALAAVLLWRRVAWGYTLGAALLIAGVFSQIGYMIALVFQATGEVAGATAFDPAEPFIFGSFLIATLLLLRHVHEGDLHRAIRLEP